MFELDSAGSAAFDNRRHAGQQLAAKLQELLPSKETTDLPPIVFGLPRGGVPVAFEVAVALRAPLHVFLVRKLGLPSQPEFAIGAIASGGSIVLDQALVEELGIRPDEIEKIVARERKEMERQARAFGSSDVTPDLAERTVILVDDGIATGRTVQVAVKAIRQMQPARIIVAVPVSPPQSCKELLHLVDDIVCLRTPPSFRAVGLWYKDFSQTTDDEVRALLADSRSRQSPHV